MTGPPARATLAAMPGFEIPTHDEEVLAALGRIEEVLLAVLAANTEQGAEMADTLDDVRSNLQELNVDVDTAVTGISDLRQQVADALANAGVDQTARDEIMGTIDGMQQRIVDALNPSVPVDPGTVTPIDPGELPPPAEG